MPAQKRGRLGPQCDRRGPQASFRVLDTELQRVVACGRALLAGKQIRVEVEKLCERTRRGNGGFSSATCLCSRVGGLAFRGSSTPGLAVGRGGIVRRGRVGSAWD